MNKKQWFLTFFSLQRKIFKKSFVISNIVFLILIAGISNIDSIIMSFGGDFAAPYTVYYEDSFNEDTELVFSSTLEYLGNNIENEVTYVSGWIELVPEDGESILVSLDENMVGTIKSNYSIPSALYNSIVQSLTQVKSVLNAEKYGLTTEEVTELSLPVTISREIIETEELSEDEIALNGGITLLIALPLFIALVMVIQMVGLEVFDEKSTRSLEVILSNIDAKTHLKSKIWASNIYILLQFLLLLGYSAIGISSRSAISNVMGVDTTISISPLLEGVAETLIIVAVLFVLSNILYSMVVAVLSSTANEMDDYQKIIQPLMILMLIGFYIAIFSQFFSGSVFIKVMAYIPFFTLMLAPSLYATNVLTLVDIGIIIFILLLTVRLFYVYGSKIYKESVLDYSNDNVFKRLRKNISRARKNRRVKES